MRIECFASWKLTGQLAGCSGLVAGYFFTMLPGLNANLIVWFGLFGLGSLASLFLMSRKGPLVIIDDTGINDRRWKLGVIPWDEVESLSIATIHSTRLLGIELVDPAKYLSQLPKWQREIASAKVSMGHPAVTVNLAGLRPGIDEVWTKIQSWDGLPIPAHHDEIEKSG